MSVDAREVFEFAAILDGAGDVVQKDAEAVVSKGALNIKNHMRSKMQGSQHFKPAAHTISYDIRTVGAFGGGIIEAEIGPGSGPGNPGALSNIAYFGTSRGGGTVEDPQVALDAEIPKFTSALSKIIGDAL